MSAAAISRVLVTGACGRIGQAVSLWLHQAGLNVRTTDRLESPDPSSLPAYVTADLRNHTQIYPLLEDIEAVVHLANHPTPGHPQTTFNENVSVNQNVFQAAVEQGVQWVVFASTIQVLGSVVDTDSVRHAPPRPSYPISGDTPPAPANTYALSKSVSEDMLRYYVDRCGLNAVALRFPLVIPPNSPTDYLRPEISHAVIHQGFSCMTTGDCAELVAAILAQPLSGFRIYSPGYSGRCPETPRSELKQKYYPELTVDDSPLIDDQRIEAETGWKPH